MVSMVMKCFEGWDKPRQVYQNIPKRVWQNVQNEKYWDKPRQNKNEVLREYTDCNSVNVHVCHPVHHELCRDVPERRSTTVNQEKSVIRFQMRSITNVLKSQKKPRMEYVKMWSWVEMKKYDELIKLATTSKPCCSELPFPSFLTNIISIPIFVNLSIHCTVSRYVQVNKCRDCYDIATYALIIYFKLWTSNRVTFKVRNMRGLQHLVHFNQKLTWKFIISISL